MLGGDRQSTDMAIKNSSAYNVSHTTISRVAACRRIDRKTNILTILRICDCTPTLSAAPFNDQLLDDNLLQLPLR
jgi:hypothetical protein